MLIAVVFGPTPRQTIPARFIRLTSFVVPNPMMAAPLTVEANPVNCVAASAEGVASAVVDFKAVVKVIADASTVPVKVGESRIANVVPVPV